MISVLLPTIRPHLVRRALDSIALAARLTPYEVIVVADFGPEVVDCTDPAVVWVQRERKGVVDAVVAACGVATGEYWFLFNDESILYQGALDILHREAVSSKEPVMWTVKHLPEFPFRYYGLPFAPFPFMHRDLVAKLGGLLDPVYRGFYADPDLSLRAHAAGVPIRVVPGAILKHANNHDATHQQAVSSYLDADRATFRSRWDHLGEFADP